MRLTQGLDKWVVIGNAKYPLAMLEEYMAAHDLTFVQVSEQLIQLQIEEDDNGKA